MTPYRAPEPTGPTEFFLLGDEVAGPVTCPRQALDVGCAGRATAWSKGLPAVRRSLRGGSSWGTESAPEKGVWVTHPHVPHSDKRCSFIRT